MQIAIPQFQYRFVRSMGNIIHPGNFHPVGTQVVAERMIGRIPADASAGAGGAWIIVGASGGFGSAARIVLGQRLGAHTLNVSLDAQPAPDSTNKLRAVGSPGFHRNLAIERALRARGTTARSLNGDAFNPEIRAAAIREVQENFGGKVHGLVWALAAPRAIDSRTGQTIQSSLKPLGAPVRVKNFTGRDLRAGELPKIAELELPPGSPEEAIRTIFVMGGAVVREWVEALLAADVLASGFRLITISYRGNPLNEGVYRKGLIGLAKADLEFETTVIHNLLQTRVQGQAVAVEGPAVITEASGGIPGVPFYLGHLLDVMGPRFEDPLASMDRLFAEKLPPEGPVVDGEGLVRLDERELEGDVQAALQARYDAAKVGDDFDLRLYDLFMSGYSATRGFDVAGVDYEAEFDSDEICREG